MRSGGRVRVFARLLLVTALAAMPAAPRLVAQAPANPAPRLVAQTPARSAQAAAGESSSAESSSTFAPLEQWKTAVIAGSPPALGDLYLKDPPARARTPQGDTMDPGEEPQFWSLLSKRGIRNFNPKILEIQRPQQGAVALVLRVEFVAHTDSGDQPMVISTSQVWVQQGGAWKIYISQRGQAEPNPTFRLPQPAKPNTDLYPPPAAAPAEIDAALRAAARDHKRVILVFGGNWCYDCHVLDATFHSSKIASLVNANYHVVHVNIGDGDKNLDLADKYGVPLRKAVRVPSLAVLDSRGKVIYSQRNGEFDDSARLSPEDVTEFLEKWKPAHAS
jgi:thioredoxin 1